jgi:hypothetical protein
MYGTANNKINMETRSRNTVQIWGRSLAAPLLCVRSRDKPNPDLAVEAKFTRALLNMVAVRSRI